MLTFSWYEANYEVQLRNKIVYNEKQPSLPTQWDGFKYDSNTEGKNVIEYNQTMQAQYPIVYTLMKY